MKLHLSAAHAAQQMLQGYAANAVVVDCGSFSKPSADAAVKQRGCQTAEVAANATINEGDHKLQLVLREGK